MFSSLNLLFLCNVFKKVYFWELKYQKFIYVYLENQIIGATLR